MRRIMTKTMSVIFNMQNSQLLTFSFPTEKQLHGQNWLVANLPVVDFPSQPRENPRIHYIKQQSSIIRGVGRFRGGSDGFQGGRRGNQSSLTEYNGGCSGLRDWTCDLASPPQYR